MRRERIEFKHAKNAERVMTDMLVKGLLECDSGGHSRAAGASCRRRCCRTYDGLVALYPNNSLPAGGGPDGKVGPVNEPARAGERCARAEQAARIALTN